MLHNISRNALDEIVTSYAATALWSSYDWDADPEGNGYSALDENYDVTDISRSTLEGFENDITGFLDLLSREEVDFNGEEITAEMISSRMSWSQFGHDFWLTRNGHGAGFWDRGLGDFGEHLTKWAKTFGEVSLFVNDNNEIEAD